MQPGYLAQGKLRIVNLFVFMLDFCGGFYLLHVIGITPRYVLDVLRK